MLLLRLLILRLMADKNLSCERGWTNASRTRRITTLAWALTYVLRNGHLGTAKGEDGIKETDLFPKGLNRSTGEDVARIQGLLGEWLDYWSEKHPSDSLENAMIELIARLVMAKRGWLDERNDEPFPLKQVIEGVQTEKFEKWLNEQVR